MKTQFNTVSAAIVVALIGLLGPFQPAAIGSTTLIDYQANDGGVPPEVGFAAVGLTSTDYWNLYDAANNGALTNLKFVDGTFSGVGVAITNATGAGNNGAADDMYQGYSYPSSGGNISLTITNLSAGSYDFFFYGHGNVDNQNSVFQLSVGGVSQGSEATTNGTGWISPVWQEGVQYVEFTNVSVAAGQMITVQVEPGASSYAPFSGMQIETAGPIIPVLTANSQSISAVENVFTPVTLTGSSTVAGALVYTVVTQPTNGTLSGTAPNLAYLPSTNFTGPDSFTFEINEGAVTSAVASVSVSVITNLVAYWPLNGNTLDASINGFNATNYGASPATDRFGNANAAYSFAGTTNVIAAGQATNFDSPQHTLSLWLNVSSFHSPISDIVAKQNTTGGLEWMMQITPAAHVRNAITMSNGSLYYFDSVQTLATGTWYQAVMVWDGTNDYTYINGVLDSSVPSPGPILAENALIRMGNDAYFPGQEFLGSMNDVRYYNVALTPAQVQVLYEAETNPPPTTGLPVVLSQPTSQTVASGNQASFSSQAAGSPSTIQWYGTNAGGSNAISGGTNTNLTFTANDGTAGGYWAVFSNSFGMATTAVAFLSVVDPPGIITSPLSQTANAGAPVTFTASASGTSDTVQWYLINYLGTNAVAGGTSNSLTITASGPAAGSYFAVFQNYLGSATTSAASLGVLNLPFVNGGFEVNTNGAVISAGNGVLLNPGDTWMQGWTIGGPGNDVAVIDGLDAGVSPYNGSQWIDFHWYSNPSGGTMAQTFTTTIGQVYEVTFEASELRAGGPSMSATAYSASGLLLGSNYCVPPTATVWTQFQLSFTAVSTNTTLLFKDTSASGTPDLNFDGVTVNTAPTTGIPVLLQSPSSQTVNSGTQVSFTALAGGSPSSIQWYLTNSSGSNAVAGGTSSPLLVTANDGIAGGYTAVFSNSYGMATSAVAVLGVIDPPGIITSPLSQTANAGSPVTFTASASGTTNSVQWYFINYLGTNAVSGGISNSLTLTAASLTAGSYYAVFHNSAGSATTSAANLGVLGLTFTNGSFEVISNHAVIPSGGQALLTVGSTWMVGWTVGGPGNDIYVINGTAVGLSPYNGQQWIDFNGNNSAPGGTLAQTFTTTVGQTYVATFGVGELATGAQSLTAMAFGSNNLVLASNYCVPTSQVWTQFKLNFAAISTNTTLFFKDSSTITTPPDLTLDNVTVVSPPVITTNPVSQTVTNGNSVTFTAAASGSPSTVQWWLNVTNLVPGATSTTLTFTANATNGGNYTAVFTNAAGTAVTRPALLTVDNPVFLTQQPQSVITNIGANVTFTGAAGGDAPITLQWQFDGTNISGATNASLTLGNVQMTNAGNYALLATNAYGWAASSNATLAIISTLQIPSTNVAGASSVTIPVNLLATGNESVATFSLDFDPTVLTFVSIAPGSGASGAAFTPNTNSASSGRIGLLVGYIGGNFAPGTQPIAQVTFAAVLSTNTVATGITFGSTPSPQKIIDASFDQLSVAYLAATITVTPTSLEGDVWPRVGGNYVLDANDWQQEGRFVVGLDTVSNASEMQRADCAPRVVSGSSVTSGDGVINALDLAQAGRYVIGLDPLTAMGGVDLAGSSVVKANGIHANTPPGQSARTLSLVPMTNVANTVAVQLIAQGNENTVDFSVTYDPTIASFVSATKGAGTTGALFIVNSAVPGQLGVALSLQPGQAFPAGTNQIAQINFTPVSYSNTVALVFTNSPAQCSIADVTATNLLTTTYQSGALAVSGTVWPTLNIGPVVGNNINLTWPVTTTNFIVQATTNLGAAWSGAGGTAVTNGGTVSVTVPAPTNTTFYRLSQP